MPAKNPVKISGTARGRASIKLSQGRGIRGRIVLNLGTGKTVPKKGGKKMPRRMPKRKPVQPKVPRYKIPGQSAEFVAQGSNYGITRQKDQFKIHAPKKPRVRYV